MSLTTAIVQIDVEADRIPEAAEAIVNIDGVTEVYSITGDWDLLVMVRVTDHEQLAEIIPNQISKVDGVVRTETQLAFRAYSRHDLEAAFSLGMPLKMQPPRNVPSSALLPCMPPPPKPEASPAA